MKSGSVQGLPTEDTEMVTICQILKGFECRSKYGCYPEENKEPGNDFEWREVGQEDGRIGFVIFFINLFSSFCWICDFKDLCGGLKGGRGDC